MIVNFCGLRLGPTRPNRSPEKDSENEKCGLAASVAKFLKPRSSWAAMKAKKRPSQELQGNNSKGVTLKALIASSPSACHVDANMRQYPSSRKIHPSFGGGEVIDQEFLVMESVSTRNETGNSSKGKMKMKKKVSFRSPEVANVYVVDRYSPEMNMCTVGQ